jgi:N-glycosylase/DNA lyase
MESIMKRDQLTKTLNTVYARRDADPASFTEENKEYMEKLEAGLKKLEKRIKEFSNNLKNDQKVLEEFGFCIFAANSKALAADRAIELLKKRNMLYSDNKQKIAKIIVSCGVRFHNKKAKYFIEGRKKLFEQKKFFEYLKNSKNEIELRDKLIKNINGFGLKEASHFLRNIGVSKNLAIIDRHILKKLKEFKIIKKLPTTLTKKRYLKIEKRIIDFSKKIKIPINKLDLYLWAEQTGFVFK